jgi:hypothetical protein
MPREGHCGKYERTAETAARQRASAAAHWADPDVRRRHAEFVRMRMSRPEVRALISARTREALAAKDAGAQQ